MAVQPQRLAEGERHQPAEARVAGEDRARSARGSAPTWSPRGSACRRARPSISPAFDHIASRSTNANGRLEPASRAVVVGERSSVATTADDRSGDTVRSMPRRSPIDACRPSALVLGPVASVQFGARVREVAVRRSSGRAARCCCGSCSRALILVAALAARACAGRCAAEWLLMVAFGVCLGGHELSPSTRRSTASRSASPSRSSSSGRSASRCSARARRSTCSGSRWRRAGILLLADLGGGSLDTARGGARAARGRVLGRLHLVAARVGQVFPGGAGLALAMVVAARGRCSRSGSPRAAPTCSTRPCSAVGARRGDPVVGDPLLARARGAAAAAAPGLRRADEPRAGDGGARRPVVLGEVLDARELAASRWWWRQAPGRRGGRRRAAGARLAVSTTGAGTDSHDDAILSAGRWPPISTITSRAATRRAGAGPAAGGSLPRRRGRRLPRPAGAGGRAGP